MKKAVSLPEVLFPIFRAFDPKRWKTSLDNWQKKQQLSRMGHIVAVHSNRKDSSARKYPSASSTDSEEAGPVIFFNASARLGAFSQNAAFSLLSSWGLRLAGMQVIHFVCESGLQPCVLGTNREDYSTPPPCTSCIALSRKIFRDAETRAFKNQKYPDLAKQLQSLNVESLSSFSYQSPIDGIPAIPLGRLILPAARWALRKHDLEDTPNHQYLLRQYIQSAFNVIQQFDALIQETSRKYRKYSSASSAPSCVVIFNGIMYPEAAARWISQQRNLRVITHEVGFQKFSAFFSHGDATAYPIDIPTNFELDTKQNDLLNDYLEKRFQGKFSMAGIQFWPEMHGLDQAFLEKMVRFHQADGTFRMVPIFTNVVYDTSQVHANVVFPHMFAWLDLLQQVIQSHPETLFVIRAHPDEMRPGTAKQSRQTVRDWIKDNALLQLPNVVFIDSLEYISSYELIQKAKFVMVYNSSIGLEAALMGKPVLCGGKARYTQSPSEVPFRIVFFPPDIPSFHAQLEEFLNKETIFFPEEFQRNARHFLYYQLYRASLPFDRYLETGRRAGFVHLKQFPWQDLLPERSTTIQTILNGVRHGSEFLLPEENLL